ncbi:MAG TPA: bifunctional phosphoribosyl-AMP cyclohydrolase/phosphoribosyl-ATP diphosphatase HisIE [Gemmatimonadaceae bacterium]|nr:bifunctional phosphoribosyl-AMP cyclohydrolase/phosphoribosyl-ATP diphosphatase HisIE [Gemmatimonadaceae bacterium]
MIDLDAVDFAKGGGLVTVVCQDHLSGAVLMVAHANREALERTRETGDMHYWSRTRGLWRKGESSGSTQRVKELRYDCDADAILARVEAILPACHTGSDTCFGDVEAAAGVLDRIDGVIRTRAEARGEAPSRPSYTRRLLADRNLRLKKLGEEAAELVTACADLDADRACEEAADLIYHTLVAVRAAGGSLRQVQAVLARRHAAG